MVPVANPVAATAERTDAAVPLPLAAKRAGMTDSRMRRRLLAGEVSGFQAGGRWFIDATSLEAFIAAQRAD